MKYLYQTVGLLTILFALVACGAGADRDAWRNSANLPAPVGVVIARGSKQITPSWTAVTAATSYNVYYRTTAGVTASNATNKISNASSGTPIIGLLNGTPYYLVVTAINQVGGESAVSTEVSMTPSPLWAAEAYLKAPNVNPGDFFGESVAVDVDTIVVGASREASSQTTISNGGSASEDNSAGEAGAAYVFKRTGSSWAQEAYLKASNANANDYFGYSVAVNADTIVVGAFGEASSQTTITNGSSVPDNNLAGEAGAAYVFKRTGSSWAQEAYLKAPNANAADFFGISVALNADTIVVGAFGEASNQNTITNSSGASTNNDFSNAGAAYVFKLN